MSLTPSAPTPARLDAGLPTLASTLHFATAGAWARVQSVAASL